MRIMRDITLLEWSLILVGLLAVLIVFFLEAKI